MAARLEESIQNVFGELKADNPEAKAYLQLAATNKDGSFSISRSFTQSPLDNKLIETEEHDTIFWIASFTKLVTTIAALQNVENGLLQLDTDVGEVMPELKSPMILKGFKEDSNEPILEPAKNYITLRQLLTHQSGLEYPGEDNLIGKYLKLKGKEPSLRNSVVDLYPNLLSREPGSEWGYSTGLDYAGLMVERVNNMKLEEYFQRHIFEPLGIKELSFYLNDSTRPRRVPQWYRIADGSLKPTDHVFPDPTRVELGGGGLFGTAKEYVRVLQSLLQDNCPLLSDQTRNMMFSPQLDSEKYAKFAFTNTPANIINTSLGSVPRSTKVSWGLSGVLTLEDIPNARKSHSLHWTGLPNCFWWLDRKAGIGALVLSQVLPPGDPRVLAVLEEFEKSIYAKLTS